MAATFGRWPRIGVLVAGLLLLAGMRGPRPRTRRRTRSASRVAEAQHGDHRGRPDGQAARAGQGQGEGEEGRRRGGQDDEGGEGQGREAVQLQRHADPRPGRATSSSDYDTAEKFYEHQIELATKVKSGTKMLQAYENLIDLYFDAKRYDDAVDTCEKVMDMTGPKEVEDAKPFILERLIQAKARQGKIEEALNDHQEADRRRPAAAWYFLQTQGLGRSARTGRSTTPSRPTPKCSTSSTRRRT